MTYRAALAFLERLPSFERQTARHLRAGDLNRMQRLLALLDHPEQGLTIVHITGSKGKGSTLASLAAVLTAHRKRVVAFSSPHFFTIRERLQFQGKLISERTFAALVDTIRPFARRVHATDFETLTAMALLFAKRRKADFTLLEVGLGGRCDATNAFPRKMLTALTHLEREHEDVLGKGLRRIALEKLQITRQGVPLVSVWQPQPLLAIIRQFCRRHDVKLSVLPRVHAPLLENQQLALTLAKILLPRFSAHTAQKALSHTALPGQREHYRLLNRTVLVDVSHTPDSARLLRSELDRLFTDQPILFLFGCFRDKRVPDIFRTLLRRQDRILLTTLPHPRAYSASELAAQLRQSRIPIIPLTIDSPHFALRAISKLPKTLPVCITGSHAWGTLIAAASKIPPRST